MKDNIKWVYLVPPYLYIQLVEYFVLVGFFTTFNIYLKQMIFMLPMYMIGNKKLRMED